MRNALKQMRRRTTNCRYRAGASFSLKYATKLRSFGEEKAWTDLGFAYRTAAHCAIYIPETKAVYIAISKSANTTLKMALAKHPPADNPAQVHSHRRAGLASIANMGLTLGDLAKGQHRIFTIVRNPIGRFWSAYRNRILNDKPPSREIREKLALSADTKLNPDHVLTYLETHMTPVIDQHFLPQWSSNGAGLLPFSYIGKVETLDEDVAHLVELGLFPQNAAAALGHFNVSVKRADPQAEQYLPRICRIYQRDFETFGYHNPCHTGFAVTLSCPANSA